MLLDTKNHKPRLLLLPKYGEEAASGRLRCYQYVPYLKQAGFEIKIQPLFDHTYLSRLFSGQRVGFFLTLSLYLKRTITLLTVSRNTRVVLHCDDLPFIPGVLMRYLKMRGVGYIYDYDDAIFHGYDMHRFSIVRHFYKNKIANIIKNAAHVFAGSHYLADYAQRYNRSVSILPTVIDIDRYPCKEHTEKQELAIAWIGSPSTSVYLKALIPVFKTLAVDIAIRVIVIGGSIDDINGVVIEKRPWSEETEVSDLLDCDIGIMPLIDDPWSRGKCAYKLIQYMACALPVIASPVGENKVVVEDGVNGYLAQNDNAWREAILKLASNANLRRDMGKKGRELIISRYTVQSRYQDFVSSISTVPDN